MPESTAVLTPAEEDLPCPLCTYNLRGLANPRCPECGYAFTWPALLAARDSLHPYLFKHHPHRAAWSFRQTFLRGLLPRRFWTTLNAAHAVRPRRLLLYHAIVLSLFLAAAAAILIVPITNAVAGVRWDRAKAIQQLQSQKLPPSSIPLNIDRWYPPAYTVRGLQNIFWHLNPTLPILLLFVLAWPWLTAAALMLFQQSMHRARIRPAQILRCVIYAYDPAALIFIAIAAWSTALDGRIATPVNLLAAEELFICLFAGYRLAVAYRRYLTFSHAYTTVASTQIIVLLLGVIAWFRLYW